ncbi:hypothetical protein [Clostridium butyricum]|nr:hypothetical protein [Clostridium butyricum]MDU3597543.1 hypothetical protein [Clostridium butyricum]
MKLEDREEIKFFIKHGYLKKENKKNKSKDILNLIMQSKKVIS